MREVLRHTGLSFIFLMCGSVAWADLKDTLLAEGNALYDRKEYAAAGAVFAKLIEADPTSADGYYGRALVNAAKGDYDAAISDFSETIRRNPQKADAYRNRGWAYYEKKQRCVLRNRRLRRCDCGC
jgi:tetratricopeptide (TPR) repeat protein